MCHLLLNNFHLPNKYSLINSNLYFLYNYLQVLQIQIIIHYYFLQLYNNHHFCYLHSFHQHTHFLLHNHLIQNITLFINHYFKNFSLFYFSFSSIIHPSMYILIYSNLYLFNLKTYCLNFLNVPLGIQYSILIILNLFNFIIQYP